MGAWTLECHPVGPLQMNAWLLLDQESGEAALIDPGEESDRLLARIDASGCQLRWLLATHGHFDHVGDAAAVQKRWDLPLLIHPGDTFLVDAMQTQQASYGLPVTAQPRVEATLAAGQAIPLGQGQMTVTPVPGHSPGQVMFHWDGHAIVGDCLFAGGVGRTDLPGGSFDQLENSIRQRIYTLPDHTAIHPGHGPDTTVAREKSSNPFVRGD